MNFGSFKEVCRSSTLPVCNLFYEKIKPYCVLYGVKSTATSYVRNPGDISFSILAALVALWLVIRSQTKFAAVGRREMQILILIYFFISIFQIFTIGGFITNIKLLAYFTAVHIGLIAAFFWVLLVNAIVGYQLFEDGTVFSVLITLIPSLLLFLSSGYIVLDSIFFWTKSFVSSSLMFQNYGIYILYFLWSLLCIIGYFILEFILVFKILQEWKPLLLLSGSLILFIIGQLFNFLISKHICQGTQGKIDGSFIGTLFVLLSVILLYKFWDSITEDDWDEPMFQETQMANVPKFDFSP
ncbi:hypothetical protein T552_01954 [Pneumocystis carinii B80]|uniref:Uncharacterized protein n=1 Tax=Pneumocystis carinii (strain B80) TaxID=1408658 RepID=A0A0W4ZI83_PNEC8|nr:hypothetical protein T552_01954 [Pneumocystis carinii B80]KTW28093.1 hypothetical protein T552_01954 [Pneumocystis carinii B80]